MLSILWQICDFIRLIFNAANGQILENNLTIRSHWNSLLQQQAISSLGKLTCPNSANNNNNVRVSVCQLPKTLFNYLEACGRHFALLRPKNKGESRAGALVLWLCVTTHVC